MTTATANKLSPTYYITEITKRVIQSRDPEKTPEHARDVFFDLHPEVAPTLANKAVFDAGFEYGSNLVTACIMLHAPDYGRE